MKKLFESSTLRGVLAGFLVCCLFGIIVFADDHRNWKFLDTWGSTQHDNKLTATTWDAVLDELDHLRKDLSGALNDSSIAIPNGAIMAFDSTDGCPDGWEIYELANGRVLMGVGSENKYLAGRTAGSSTVRLYSNNVPAHSHFYKDTLFSEGYVDNGNLNMFTRDEYANAVNNDSSITKPVKIVGAGYRDTPYYYMSKQNSGTPVGVLVGSNEGYDTDNFPYYGIRRTSDYVCGYSDFYAAGGNVTSNLVDFGGDKLYNYLNNYCNLYTAEPFSIEYSNVKVVYCKKVSNRAPEDPGSAKKGCWYGSTSVPHGTTKSVYFNSTVQCTSTSSKCEQKSVKCDDGSWYYGNTVVSNFYTNCSTIDNNPHGCTSTSSCGSAGVLYEGYVSSNSNTSCSKVYTCKTSSGGGGGGGGCFLAGTKVLTDVGSKNIEDIQTGDVVLSYNTKTNQTEYKKVTEKLVHENNDEDLYELTINGSVLKVTSLHKFYLKGNIYNNYCFYPLWRSTLNLHVGDILLMDDGTDVVIENIEHYPYHGTVYNLEIEDNHNYYVDKGYLVHNSREKDFYQKMEADERIN